jgi:hypothetical protein
MNKVDLKKRKKTKKQSNTSHEVHNIGYHINTKVLKNVWEKTNITAFITAGSFRVFLHENHGFFEVFEITGIHSSFIPIQYFIF